MSDPKPVDHAAMREHARAVNEWAAAHPAEQEVTEPETGATP